MKLDFGPGVLVAAAFIGPGTVTACTLAGANFGFVLIWALVFATLATIILQDMSARLGAGAQLGLGEALMQSAKQPALKWIIGGLVFAALMIGNSAYEAGNLAGGALGIEAVLSGVVIKREISILLIAVFAAVVVSVGRYDVLEKVLITLVLIMSLAFILSTLFVRPDVSAFFAGFVPRIPEAGLFTAIALIGTTIVPYNLFLHAAASKRKWEDGQGTGAARKESAVSIGLGGLVSILILTTAASSLFMSGLEITNAADMALAIEPTFGETARYLIGIGLFAAGLTSAITAPMATAYALSEMIGGDGKGQRSNLFRGIALAVIAIGTLISLTGIRPVSMILIAQYANGLLLPIIAAFLLYVMNQKALLGPYVNSVRMNVFGIGVVLITFGLGLRALLRAAGWMP